MNKLVKTKDLFQTENPLLKETFKASTYPWEILSKIKEICKKALEEGIPGYTLLKEGVLVGKGKGIDIVNVDRLNRYNFDAPTKSVYKCHHFHTQRIKCYNTQYVCVKVWFRCNHATIIKYLFFNRIKNFKYRTIALKQINYLIHSGRLNNYIKLQLDLMEEKNTNK